MANKVEFTTANIREAFATSYSPSGPSGLSISESSGLSISGSSGLSESSGPSEPSTSYFPSATPEESVGLLRAIPRYAWVPLHMDTVGARLPAGAKRISPPRQASLPILPRQPKPFLRNGTLHNIVIFGSILLIFVMAFLILNFLLWKNGGDYYKWTVLLLTIWVACFCLLVLAVVLSCIELVKRKSWD